MEEAGIKSEEKKLLHPGVVLYFGDVANIGFKTMIDQHKTAKLMNHWEIMSKYPAFENLPDHYVGIEVDNGGIIKSKSSLNALQLLSVRNGADLRYNTEVKEIKKDHVVLKNGNIVRAKNVVCCCGPHSVKHDIT